MFTSNIAITRDKVILGDFKNAFKNKIIINNNNNNNELQSSCHCFETRVNTVKEKFWRNCLQVSRKRRKEQQRWWLGKCLNWVTVTICFGKRATRQVCRFFSVHSTKDSFVPWAGLFGNRSQKTSKCLRAHVPKHILTSSVIDYWTARSTHGKIAWVAGVWKGREREF